LLRSLDPDRLDVDPVATREPADLELQGLDVAPRQLPGDLDAVGPARSPRLGGPTPSHRSRPAPFRAAAPPPLALPPLRALSRLARPPPSARGRALPVLLEAHGAAVGLDEATQLRVEPSELRPLLGPLQLDPHDVVFVRRDET